MYKHTHTHTSVHTHTHTLVHTHRLQPFWLNLARYQTSCKLIFAFTMPKAAKAMKAMKAAKKAAAPVPAPKVVNKL